MGIDDHQYSIFMGYCKTKTKKNYIIHLHSSEEQNISDDANILKPPSLVFIIRTPISGENIQFFWIVHLRWLRNVSHQKVIQKDGFG